MSKRIYHMRIPIFIVSALAAFFIVQYFAAYNTPMADLNNEILLWSTIIASLAGLYGTTILVLMHVRRLSEGRDLPGYRRNVFRSGSLLGMALVLMAIALVYPGLQNGDVFQFWYLAIPGMAAVASQMAWVFHAHAPIRVFRITSIETAIFFASWLFVCTGELTVLVVVWPPFATIDNWIRTVVNPTGERASIAAAAVGAMVLAVRTLGMKEPGLIEMEA